MMFVLTQDQITQQMLNSKKTVSNDLNEENSSKKTPSSADRAKVSEENSSTTSQVTHQGHGIKRIQPCQVSQMTHIHMTRTTGRSRHRCSPGLTSTLAGLWGPQKRRCTRSCCTKFGGIGSAHWGISPVSPFHPRVRGPVIPDGKYLYYKYLPLAPAHWRLTTVATDCNVLIM
jgi:hypothetical protein